MALDRLGRAIALSLVLLLCSCGEGPGEEQEIAGTRDYTILNEEIDESPGKTQLIINTLVSPDATKDELSTLLSSLYENASKRSGFRFHPNPTVIAIYAYPSREHAESGMGQWIGMLSKSAASEQPDVIIGHSVGRESPVESRFGFSLTERREIYRMIVSAEDEGQIEAERQHPGGLERQFDLADELADGHKNRIASELEITREQLDEIAREGLLNNWPMPK